MNITEACQGLTDAQIQDVIDWAWFYHGYLWYLCEYGDSGGLSSQDFADGCALADTNATPFEQAVRILTYILEE